MLLSGIRRGTWSSWNGHEGRAAGEQQHQTTGAEQMDGDAC